MKGDVISLRIEYSLELLINETKDEENPRKICNGAITAKIA